MRKTVITISNKSYEVNFPNVGQMQDIETNKIAYTNGRYADMAVSGLTTHNFALDTADTISYFSVLIPLLKKDLGIDNWRELDAFDMKELIKVYKDQFLSWYKPLVDELYNFQKKEDSKPQDVDEQT